MGRITIRRETLPKRLKLRLPFSQPRTFYTVNHSGRLITTERTLKAAKRTAESARRSLRRR